MKAGTKLSQEILDELPKSQWQQIAVKDDAVQKLVEAQIANFETAVAALQARFTDKVDKLQGGDELLPWRYEDGQSLCGD
jgi:DNA-directed RNA polymerase subunit beta